jgi:GDSL-like Lipase/Acylhydrolase family
LLCERAAGRGAVADRDNGVGLPGIGVTVLTATAELGRSALTPEEPDMGHAVLLGDSIFDNARYVLDQPPVVEQVRKNLPSDWRVTLLAIDGHVTDDVENQLRSLPADATLLVVSAGGNDALGESSSLAEVACTVGEAFCLFHEVRTRFRDSYRSMLNALAKIEKPTAVCTIYDAIPGLGEAERTALAGFNEIILREAFAAGLPVIDLRLVCDRADDYSHVSRIEPSVSGGSKIARAIARMATNHDFNRRMSTVYL